jgi:hypothetical protein
VSVELADGPLLEGLPFGPRVLRQAVGATHSDGPVVGFPYLYSCHIVIIGWYVGGIATSRGHRDARP